MEFYYIDSFVARSFACDASSSTEVLDSFMLQAAKHHQIIHGE